MQTVGEQRERDRQTDRDRDRNTERDRETERDRKRQRERDVHKQTDTDREPLDISLQDTHEESLSVPLRTSPDAPLLLPGVLDEDDVAETFRVLRVSPQGFNGFAIHVAGDGTSSQRDESGAKVDVHWTFL